MADALQVLQRLRRDHDGRLETGHKPVPQQVDGFVDRRHFFGVFHSHGAIVTIMIFILQ